MEQLNTPIKTQSKSQVDTDEAIFRQEASKLITSLVEGKVDETFACYLACTSKTRLTAEEMGRILRDELLYRLSDPNMTWIDPEEVRQKIAFMADMHSFAEPIESETTTSKCLADITEIDTKLYHRIKTVTVNGEIIPHAHRWWEVVYTGLLLAIEDCCSDPRVRIPTTGLAAEFAIDKFGRICGLTPRLIEVHSNHQLHELSAKYVCYKFGQPSWLGTDPSKMLYPIALGIGNLFYDRSSNIWEAIHALQLDELPAHIRFDLYVELDNDDKI